mmetsp:Transcript_6400/g.5706  ORF Transcript_6400/g.5706 Transcript_6400/m.5706 type:complete len:393 (+) Transcript_6400:652-1830(+)
MRVPADCILLEGTDVAADESGLTGEPEQLEKTPLTDNNFEHNPVPFLLAKTLIVSGQGVALILAVGTNTRSGMAEEKLNIEEEETPLQAKLETIANEIGKIGVYVAILTFIAMTVNLIISTALDDTAELLHIDTLSALVSFLIIAITVIVVAVPEGLPLAVTIALAFSVMKMKKENNLVRKLHASETMGGANEICTDKTGTLTKNLMSVMEFYTQDRVYEGRPVNFSTLKVSQLMTEGVLFNCSARVEKNEAGEFETKGNCTEQGLIKFLMDVGVNAYETILKKDDNILQLIPFNSERKRACAAIRHPDDQNKVRVYLKGAPEIVMDYCSSYVNDEGEAINLTQEKKSDILLNVVTEKFAKNARRTLLISYSDMTMEEYEQLKAANNNFSKE